MKTTFASSAGTKRFEQITVAGIAMVLAGFLSGCAMDSSEDVDEGSAQSMADESLDQRGTEVRDSVAPRMEDPREPVRIHVPQVTAAAGDQVSVDATGVAETSGDAVLLDADRSEMTATGGQQEAGLGEECGQFTATGRPTHICSAGLRCQLTDSCLPDLGGACVVDELYR